MATLQKLRNKAGLFVAGAIGLALFAFILEGLFSSGSTIFNKIKDRAFSVAGQTISTGAYQARVTEWEEFQKIMSGNNSLDDNAQSQIRERVYQQMAKEIMLDKQAAKLGLTVSKEEMNDMVYGQNISPILTQLPIFMDQNRQFSREALTGFLKLINTNPNNLDPQQLQYAATYKTLWAFIERTMKYQRLEEKYTSLLGSAIMANKIEAKQNFDDSKYTADISYVLQRYSSLPDSAFKVSSSEIDKLYAERKKSFRTYVDASKVSYFVKDLVPSQEDYKEAEKTINQAKEKLSASDANAANVVSEYSEVPYQDIFISANSLPAEEKTFAQTAAIGEVKGPVKTADAFTLIKLLDKTVAPDSVKVQVIVVPETAGKASKADSILNVIKGGKDFDAVAKELGQSSGKGGEWVTESMLATADKDLLKACFTTAKGEITKLVKNGQAQLIKIEDRTAPVNKVKVAFVQVPVVASDKTQNSLDAELNKFVSDFGTADKFVKAARDKGYNLVQDATVTTSDVALGQVQGTHQVVSWAFNEKVNTVKKFDFSDKRIVAMIVKKVKAGYAPVEEVAPVLKAEIIKNKKAEKMIADLKAKKISSLDQYATAMSSRVDTVKFVNFATNTLSGIGREPALNVYSEQAKPNTLVGPIKGENGVIALQITARTESPNKQYNEKEMAQSILQGNLYRILYQSMEVLKTKMKVEDNRSKFF